MPIFYLTLPIKNILLDYTNQFINFAINISFSGVQMVSYINQTSKNLTYFMYLTEISVDLFHSNLIKKSLIHMAFLDTDLYPLPMLLVLHKKTLIMPAFAIILEGVQMYHQVYLMSVFANLDHQLCCLGHIFSKLIPNY